MIKENQGIEEPLLRALYVYKAGEELKVELGSVMRKSILEGNRAPRLYENIKCE